MNNSSEPNPLSQPLSVETDTNEHPHGIGGDDDDDEEDDDGGSYYEEKGNFNHSIIDDEGGASLGPLPAKWEKAYTASGEVYFIDHTTGTSHWLDPRLSKFQKKSLEDCLDDELPYGWEKICDAHYGTYFIDHVNRKTQYENPVIEAKRAALAQNGPTNGFTKDPSELCGQRFRTSLVKSSRGLGFTIVGGDDGVDEFLQIKSVVPEGPAWLDGQLLTGDVIVYVNDTCVLGYTHNQIVDLFKSISVGSTVSLEVCRGYPLPFDPNDPNTEVVTTLAVDTHLRQALTEKKQVDSNYNFLDDDSLSKEVTMLEREQNANDKLDNTTDKLEVRVSMVKGNLGFGFTVADSACGQRIKKILDRQRCKNLQEGDILTEINGMSLQNMSHDEVVQVLKNCPYNSEAMICVQRGCPKKTFQQNFRNTKFRNSSSSGKSGGLINSNNNNAAGVSVSRSKTPTADLYSTQAREILPSRPKTPLVDTRGLKTPVNNCNNDFNKYEFSNNAVCDNNCDCAQLQFTLMDNVGDEEDIELQENNIMPNKYAYDYHLPPNEPKYSNSGYNYMNLPMNDGSYPYTGGILKKSNGYDMWHYPPPPPQNEYLTTAITLLKKESGFGFRIVGGIEDKSQVAVGHIVPGGAAEMDGRIRSGDEIMSVNGFSVVKASHRQVVQLMNSAATMGQVNLVLRRRKYPLIQQQPPPQISYQQLQLQQQVQHHQGVSWENSQSLLIPHPQIAPYVPPPVTYDVIVTRTENESFGFVIISSVNKVGSTIGRLIENSPAERCGKLRVGDYIVAVNQTDIMHLSHRDIVNLIKESGLSVTLTIAHNQDL